MKVRISVKKTRQAKALNNIKYTVPLKIMLSGEDKKQNLEKSSEQDIDARLAYIRGAIK